MSVLGEQPERNLRMVMKEKDEELLLFLEMRRREKEKNDSLLLESHDAPFGTCIYSGLVFGVFKLEQIEWKILSHRDPFYVQWWFHGCRVQTRCLSYIQDSVIYACAQNWSRWVPGFRKRQNRLRLVMLKLLYGFFSCQPNSMICFGNLWVKVCNDYEQVVSLHFLSVVFFFILLVLFYLDVFLL